MPPILINKKDFRPNWRGGPIMAILMRLINEASREELKEIISKARQRLYAIDKDHKAMNNSFVTIMTRKSGDLTFRLRKRNTGTTYWYVYESKDGKKVSQCLGRDTPDLRGKLRKKYSLDF